MSGGFFGAAFVQESADGFMEGRRFRFPPGIAQAVVLPVDYVRGEEEGFASR